MILYTNFIKGDQILHNSFNSLGPIYCHHNDTLHVLLLFLSEKLLHYEELYLTMEQERPHQEKTINKFKDKCS